MGQGDLDELHNKVKVHWYNDKEIPLTIYAYVYQTSLYNNNNNNNNNDNNNDNNNNNNNNK